MDLFRLTYCRIPYLERRELLLDVLARRWTARIVVLTIILHEFPHAALPEMKRKTWNVDQTLAVFGICELVCTYANEVGPAWADLVTDNGIVFNASTHTHQKKLPN